MGRGTRTIREHFGERIYELRRQRRWSQSELAHRMTRMGFSWSQTVASDAELGNRATSIEEMLALGQIFDLSDPLTLLLPVKRKRQGRTDGAPERVRFGRYNMAPGQFESWIRGTPVRKTGRIERAEVIERARKKARTGPEPLRDLIQELVSEALSLREQDAAHAMASAKRTTGTRRAK